MKLSNPLKVKLKIMNTHKTCLLGIFIDVLTKEDLPKALSNLHEAYKKDRYPKYATSINSYFFSYLHGWRLNTSSNTELLKIIRNADLVTLDSTGVCRISKFTGGSKLAHISGEDLFQGACTFLEDNHLSLYVLGGQEETNRALLGHLRMYYPKIKLVGSTTPLIFTKGNRLEESQERDNYIVEAINQAKPDLLFLQLGHPKQEIWFERVKSQLHVPIVIGIGGAIDRYLSKIIAAYPEDAVKNDTFSMLVRPLLKLIKHIPSYLKYAAWLIPLVAYNAINQTIAKLFSKKEPPKRRYFFLSSNKSFNVIPFPVIFTAPKDAEIAKWLEESIEQDYIVLDFSDLKHIDSKGIALVAETIKWAENLGKKLFMMNVHPDVRYLLKLSGIWDYFQVLEARSPQEIIYRMSEAGKGPLNYLEFYESIYQEKNEVVLSFFGELGIADDANQIIQKLQPILHQKNCLINLNYCTSIDNQGIGFLLKLQNYQKTNGFPFKITGITPRIAHQLKLAKVDHLLTR